MERNKPGRVHECTACPSGFKKAHPCSLRLLLPARPNNSWLPVMPCFEGADALTGTAAFSYFRRRKIVIEKWLFV
jgi:hypothetical protein